MSHSGRHPQTILKIPLPYVCSISVSLLCIQKNLPSTATLVACSLEIASSNSQDLQGDQKKTNRNCSTSSFWKSRRKFWRCGDSIKKGDKPVVQARAFCSMSSLGIKNVQHDVVRRKSRWQATSSQAGYALTSTLHTPTLHIPYSTLFTQHSTLHASHSTLYTPHSHTTLYTLHTLQSTLNTPISHFTLHSALSLHMLHFTLYTPHSHTTLYTLHFTLCTLHFWRRCRFRKVRPPPLVLPGNKMPPASNPNKVAASTGLGPCLCITKPHKDDVTSVLGELFCKNDGIVVTVEPWWDTHGIWMECWLIPCVYQTWLAGKKT